MSDSIRELDYRKTPWGELALRWRRSASLSGGEVYEVTLDGKMLMSSVVTDSERALATHALERVAPHPDTSPDGLRVLVGGLGLGYTAAAALADPRVTHVTVIESVAAVIDWQRRGLVPLAAQLIGDARCRIVNADFFALLESETALNETLGEGPAGGRFDAILLDIDHSPAALLHPSHATFYKPAGLRRAAAQLRPGGVLAVWSADPPEQAFVERLRAVFSSATAEEVSFPNPLLHERDRNTLYFGLRR